METIFEILKYILPAVVVFVGVYFILQNFFENEGKKQQMLLKSRNQNLVTPLRLQAYERIVLFLERISLENIVMRSYQGGKSAKMLQSDLLKTIREEYEHNLSQQVYVSNKTWAMVKAAKEETVKNINYSSDQLGDDASAMDLSKLILELSAKVDKLPTDVAIEAVKREISYSF